MRWRLHRAKVLEFEIWCVKMWISFLRLIIYFYREAFERNCFIFWVIIRVTWNLREKILLYKFLGALIQKNLLRSFINFIQVLVKSIRVQGNINIVLNGVLLFIILRLGNLPNNLIQEWLHQFLLFQRQNHQRHFHIDLWHFIKILRLPTLLTPLRLFFYKIALHTRP